MTDTPIREPWERADGETDKAFEAWTVYRDLGPSRSIRKVAEHVDKHRTDVGRWSAKFGWVERAQAWDLEQDRLKREAMARENVKAAERHARQMSSFLGAGELFAVELMRRIQDDRSLLQKIPFDELMDNLTRLSRVGPRLVVAERLARGMTTESVEVGGQIEVHRERAAMMSEDQLDAFLLGASTAQGLGAGSGEQAGPESDSEDPADVNA